LPLVEAAWSALSATATPEARPGAAGCSAGQSGASQHQTFDWHRLLVTRDLVGAEAQSYIRKREEADSTYRIVRARAALQLKARGLKPANDARVLTFKVPVNRADGLIRREWPLLNAIMPSALAEEYEGYEIILESWDDGDDYTWEGNAYVRQLSNGEWLSANEQQWLNAEPYQSVWAEEVATNLQPPQYRCRKTGSACGYCSAPGVWRCNMDRALDEAWPWCVGGGAACLMSGPKWPACAGLNCYGQAFSRYLNFSKQHFQNCWLDEEERIACGG